MNGRTKLATGGVVAVAASVAVVCAVALSNTGALADAAGSPMGLRGVVLPPAPATPASVPAPTAHVTPHAAQVVPAPDPQTVVEPEQHAASGQPLVQPEPAAAGESARSASVPEQHVVADEAGAAEDRWDRAAEWATARARSSDDINWWREREKAAPHPEAPAKAGSPSDGDFWSRDG